MQFSGTNIDPLGTLEEIIGNPVTDFPNDPGTYAPANRPQDIRYEFPERGAESHGVTEDAPTTAYFPDQVSGDARVVTDQGDSIVFADELVPPVPVAVFEVPNPLRSIRRFAVTQTIFDPYATWIGSFGAIDMSTVFQMSADENRAKVTLSVSRSYTAFANQAVNAWFAFSHDPQFQQYIVIPFSTALATPVILWEIENCKEALYFALLPITAYDSAKQLACTLNALVEYAQPIDHNPAQAQ